MAQEDGSSAALQARSEQRSPGLEADREGSPEPVRAQFVRSLRGLPVRQQVQQLRPSPPLMLTGGDTSEVAATPAVAPAESSEALVQQAEEKAAASESPDGDDGDVGGGAAGAGAPDEPGADDADDGSAGDGEGGGADAPEDGGADDVQSLQLSGGSSAAVKEAAAAGISGSSGALPHGDRIQKSFGSHDISGIKAHTDGAASAANASMGSLAYASGSHVAFKGGPDLHTAAHEAAHVIQQGQGVSLKDGIGEPGDKYERHADAVADRVVRGESAQALLTRGPDGGGAGGVQMRSTLVQREDAEGAKAPGRITLKLGERPIQVRLPKNAKKTVNVSIGRKIKGITLGKGQLKFDDNWKLKSGSIEAEAEFRLAKAKAKAEFKLGVSGGGAVSTAVAGAKLDDGGPLGGTLTLDLGKGFDGSAEVVVNGDIPIPVKTGQLVLGAGSKGTIRLVEGRLEKLELSALSGRLHDANGELVGLEGKGSYTPKAFTASGKATLLRTLSKKLGGFTFALKQGETQGQVQISNTSITSLEAAFAVDVSHTKHGLLGTGKLTGTYQKGGKITGSGKLTLEKDVSLGVKFLKATIHQGATVGLEADSSGKSTVIFSGKVSISTKKQVLATGTAEQVRYDGSKLEGQLEVTLSASFELSIKPLDVSVSSSAQLKVSYLNNEIELQADGALDVDLAWNGKGFGKLNWPNFWFKRGKLGPLPTFSLPDFVLNLDFDGFLAWLKGLFSGGGLKLPGLPDWLLDLWARIKVHLGFEFTGFAGFLDWLKGVELPFPDGIKLPSFGGFKLPSLSGLLGKWALKLKSFLGKFKVNFALPKLKGLFDGLKLPGFNFDWLKGLFNFGGGGKLGLTADGNIDLDMDGDNIPTFVATELEAGLLWNQQFVAKIIVPHMSFDGTTFKAWFNVFFNKDFGPALGGRRLTLEAGENIAVEWTAGKPVKLRLPSLTVALTEGDVTLAGGTVKNLVVDENGVQASGSVTLGTKEGFTLKAMGYEVAIAPGSQVKLDLDSNTIAGISAKNLGVTVSKGGNAFGEGKFKTLGVDAEGFTARGSLTISDQELKAQAKLGAYTAEIGADLSKPLTIDFEKSTLLGIGGSFFASVTGPKGPVADGSFKGSLSNLGGEGGAKVVGTGKLNLSDDLTIGTKALQAVIAGGLKIKVTADESGAVTVDLSGLDLTVRTGERVIAEAKAKKALIGPDGVDGDFSVTLDPNLKGQVGPLGVEVKSEGPVQLAFDGSNLALDGSGLAVKLTWKGKGLGWVRWPKWLLKLGEAFSDLWELVKSWFKSLLANPPTIDVDLGKILAWLKGLIPKDWSWLHKLWAKLETLLKGAADKFEDLLRWLASLVPSFEGDGFLGKLLDWLLNTLGSILPNLPLDKLLEWLKGLVPNFGGSDWLNKLWKQLVGLSKALQGLLQGLLEWLAKNLPTVGSGDFLSRLWEAVLGLLREVPIGPISFKWLKRMLASVLDWLSSLKLGGGGLDLDITPQGEFDFQLTEPLPSIAGRNLAATLTRAGQGKVASLTAPEMSFNGVDQIFTAKYEANFGKNFSIPVGKTRKLKFDPGAQIGVTWEVGKSLTVTVPQLGATLYDEKGKAVAKGELTNGLFGDAGLGGTLKLQSMKALKLAKAKDGSWLLEATNFGVSATVVAGKGLTEASVNGSARFLRQNEELATGSVDLTYDGDDVDGDFGLDIAPGVSIRGAQATGWNVETAESGAGIKGVVKGSELSSLKLNGAANVTKDKEPYVVVTFEEVGYDIKEGVSGTISAALAKDRTIGDEKGFHVFLPAKGSSLKVRLEKNQLAEVGGNLEAVVCDAEGSLVKGTIENASYDVEKSLFSGTGTLELMRAVSFPKGAVKNPPPGVWGVLKSAQVKATIENNKLTSFSILQLAGAVMRGPDELAWMSGGATYDFEKGELTQAQLQFGMTSPDPINVMPGVELSGLNGDLNIEPGKMSFTGGGTLTAKFGEDKIFGGTVDLHWSRQGDVDDFGGTSAKIWGTLIDEPDKGRWLKGKLEVELAPGNSLKRFEGELDFSLMPQVAGLIKVEVLKEGENLEPIIKKGTKLSFSTTLIKGRPLLSLDLAKMIKGIDELVKTEAIRFGMGGGLGLDMDSLEVEDASFGFDEDWRPSDGKLPQFTAELPLKWGLNFDAELFGLLTLMLKFYGIIGLGGRLKGGIKVPLELKIKPIFTIKSGPEGLEFSFDVNFLIAPKAELYVGLELLLEIGVKSIGLAFDFPIPLIEEGDMSFDLGTLFEVPVKLGMDFDEGGEAKAREEPKVPEEKDERGGAPHDFGEKPVPTTRSDKAGGGDSGGVLPGLGGMGQKGEKSGGLGGLQDLLDKVELIKGVAGGLEAIGFLVSMIIEGLTALMIGGPIGFVAWALWQVITGGVGHIIAAVKKVQKAITDLNKLLGPALDDPEMKWLKDALMFLDSEADDKAREAVRDKKHVGAPLKAQADLIHAMYAGFTGDEDEGAIIQVLRDTPDLEALLIAVDGDIKAGIDHVLDELQGYEDEVVRQMLRDKGLGHLISIADDVYARGCVYDGTYKEMTYTQRGALVKMMESGDCGDADEQAINQVLRFSVAKGDVGGVLMTAFGSVSSGMDDLNSSIDGSENDDFWRIMGPWFTQKGVGCKPSQRWPERFKALPSDYIETAKELLDGKKSMYKGEMTWDRCLGFLASRKPFSRPLDGGMADHSWKVLEASYGGSFSGGDREAVRKAVYGGGDLAHLKRQLSLAFLEKKGRIEDGSDVRKYLAKLKTEE